MHLLTLNAAGKQLAAPQTLAPNRRRLSQVIGRHVDRSRPHMIAVQRARDPLQPIEEAWVTRGRDRHGNVRPWPRLYLPADAIVVVVYLPRGGAGGASGGSKKSPLNIALGIAAVALVAFAGPLGVAAAGALSLGATAGTFITAGLVLGGTALLSLASRAKANKTPTDTTQIYGVTGGGNAPRPGDRIPKPYGRSWIKPDLSQPDFSQYDGDDQILFKRQTIGLGRCRVYQIRVGKQVIWAEGQGFLAPFDDARNAVEFIYGTASTLVPNNTVSATGVGGALPRPNEVPSVAGPFLINQRGALVSRLQVDFQFPQGIARTDFLKSGTTRANQPGAWAVVFEYAAIDEAGAIVGPWQVLYNGNSGAEGARFATHPLRYTRFKDVPPGRYAVRGRNIQPDTSNNTTGNATIDAAQWDAASGWVADAAIRPGVSEVCLRLYATKGSQAAAFGELEVDAAAIIPVWNGAQWVEQETSKAVWAFVDIMRNQDYGGALPDSQVDLGTALGYAANLTEFDTFDGLIRGPVSVYEAAATVLLPMRAEPVHLGRYWSLVRDEPKAVRRHVITPRQMTKGSTQLVFDLDTAAGAGHVIGEFDQDGDYRNPNQTTAIYGEASLTPTRQRWTGVRTFAHAQHLTRWRAAAGAFRRQTAPFGVEMEGRIYKRGDSILVDPWFIDARRRAGVTDNRGDALSLDADIVLQPGDAAIFRDRTGRAWGPVALAGQAGARDLRLDAAARAQVEQATGQSLASVLSDGRGEMTTVLVGPIATLAENYLIQSVKPSGPDRAQVEALIDDPRVWEAIGATIVVPPEGAAGLADPESPRIVGLTANAVQVAAGLRCDYAIQPGRGAVAFEIGLSYDDGNRFDTRPNAPISGSIDLNPVDPQSITLRARAFGVTGIPGRYFQTELSLPAAALAVPLPIITYEDLDQVIRDNLARIDTIQAQTQAAIDEANAAVDAALARLDSVRKSLSSDPAVRQRYIDPLVSGLRDDVDLLTRAITRNVQDLSLLRDNLTNAGMEVIPGEGRVRIYAIEALRDSVGETITNLAITLDALKGEIELYAANQKSDIEGVIQSITTVTTTLNALEGTITDNVTTALFDPLAARISSAETVLDAQAASISSKASQATVDAQGVRLTTAEQNISAATGEISQTITTATAGLALDLSLLPRTLAGFTDFINAQSASLNQQFAYATTNLQANFDAAGRATATLRTELLVYQDGASAQFLQITKAIADTNSALVTQTTALEAGIDTAQGQVVSESQARASADTALGQRVDSVSATVGSNTSAINTLQTAYVTADDNLARQINAVTSQTDSDRAYFLSEQQTRISNDTTIATNLTNLTVQTNNDRAYFLSEQQARITQDVAFVSDINNLYAGVGSNSASIQTTNKTVTDIYTAQASTNIDLYARSDRGTGFGRFGMTAVSAPGGVSVRLAAQVSTDSGGAQRNAGYYLDLLPDGTSRFLIDANFFAITANGGVSYPLQFDGQTLTIPILRVGTLSIGDNAVSDKQIKSGVTVDLSGPQNGGWVEIAGTAFEFDVDTNPGWGVVITGSANMQATATGTNSVYRSVSVEAAIALNGNPYNAAAFSVVSIGAGGGVANSNTRSTGTIGSTIMEVFSPGRNRISIMYRFKADAGCSGRVDFSQIKAIVIKR